MTKKEILELVKKSLESDYIISGLKAGEDSEVDIDRFNEEINSNLGITNSVKVYIEETK